MSRASKLALAALCLSVSISRSAAWAPETRLRMVDEAIRFMPASLRLALEHERDEVRRGTLEPLTAEESPDHRPPWSGGRLDARIDEEARALAEALAGANPFSSIARRFGFLAHFVSDAEFPPNAGRPPAEGPRYAHFAAFCESRRGRFPLVFYGHHDAVLDSGDYRKFALDRLGRAADDDAALARAYRAAGDPPDPAHFGDRSVPFALGSLAYSRTVTDLVRVWLEVWERAGGDMGRTPYLGTSSSPADAETP